MADSQRSGDESFRVFHMVARSGRPDHAASVGTRDSLCRPCGSRADLKPGHPTITLFDLRLAKPAPLARRLARENIQIRALGPLCSLGTAGHGAFRKGKCLV